MTTLRRMLLGAALPLLLAALPLRADTVKIAFIDPFSGPLGVIGKAGIRSFQVAEELAQEKKTASTHKLEFIEFDNKLSPSETLLQLKTAADQGFRYVIQGVGSGASAALIDAVDKHNERNPGKEILFINWTSADPELTNGKCSFWHYRLDAHADMKMEALTSYIAKSAIKKIYFINANWPGGVASAKAGKEYLKRKRPDMAIVGDDLFPIGQVKDFSPYIAKIKASGADSVFTSNAAADLSLLVKAARDANLNVDFYTLYANGGGIPTAIGAAGAGRVKLLTYFNPNAENFAAADMVERMRRKFDDDFTAPAANTGVAMLHRAFRETGSTDPVKVAFALEGMKVKSLMGEVELRKADHQAQQALYISSWEKVDGKTVRFDQEKTGYGWKPVAKIDAYVASQPTSCEMKRPKAP